MFIVNRVKSMIMGSEQPISSSKYFQDFQITGDLEQMDQFQKSKQSIIKKGLIKFIEEQGVQWSYYIQCQEKEKCFYFPLKEDIEISKFESKRGKQDQKFIYMNYLWKIEDGSFLRLLLDISTETESLEQIIFEDLLSKLLYEIKFKQSYKNAKLEQDYKKLIKIIDRPSRESSQQGDIVDLSIQFEQKFVLQEKDVDQKLSNNILDLSKKDNFKLVNSGQFYKQNEKDEIILLDEACIFSINEQKKYEFYITIYNLNQVTIYQKKITSDISYFVNIQENWIKWLEFGTDVALLLFKFTNMSVSTNVQFTISQCLYESNRQDSLKNMLTGKKSEDKEIAEYQQKVFQSNQDQIDHELLQEYQNDDNLEFDQFSISTDLENKRRGKQTNNVNICQAKILDRTFLTSGSQIGVYKNEDQTNKFITNLPIVKSMGDNELNPKKILMTMQDTKLLLMDKDIHKQIYELDLEKGKVVREFKIDGANPIIDICHENKFGDLTQNQVFNCINDRNIFKMDPRMAKGLVSNIASEQKIYSSTNGFSCIASTEEGNVAVGSSNGDLRLYSKVGQNAKNLYPGLGDPITALESSKDGKWLLATCSQYLILLPTFHENQQGFKQSIKTKDKRVPYKLTLSPADMFKYKIRNLQFQPAKFDETSDDKERYIITSTGNYTIFWSINNILSGKIYNYEIKEFQDQVFKAEFKFNNKRSILTALEGNLCMQQTRNAVKKGRKTNKITQKLD